MAIIINGTSLPDIPSELLKKSPFVVIFSIDTTSTHGYLLAASSTHFGRIEGRLLAGMGIDANSTLIGSLSEGTLYVWVSGASEWAHMEDLTAGNMRVPIGKDSDSDIYVVWTNHNIYNITSIDLNTGNYTIGNVYRNVCLPKIDMSQYPYYFVWQVTEFTGNALTEGYYMVQTKTPCYFVPKELTSNEVDQIVCESIGFVYRFTGPAVAILTGGIGWGTWDTVDDKICIVNLIDYSRIIDSNHDIYIASAYDGDASVDTDYDIFYVNPHKITTSDIYYRAIGAKVREILGESTQYKPRELPDAIRSTSSLLNPYEISRGVIFRKESIPTAITTDTLYPGAYNDVETECFFIPENVIKIAPYTFSLSDAKEVRFHDKVTTIFDYAFNAAGITTLNLPSSITSIGKIAFAACSDLVSVIINSATIPNLYGTFYQCRVLERIDIKGKVTTIDYNAFAECNSLNTLIIRGSSRASLANVNAFTNTPIASGTGYIYVPSTLLSSYKSATRWSTYASQFRAIEDYPNVCDPTT